MSVPEVSRTAGCVTRQVEHSESGIPDPQGVAFFDDNVDRIGLVGEPPAGNGPHVGCSGQQVTFSYDLQIVLVTHHRTAENSMGIS